MKRTNIIMFYRVGDGLCFTKRRTIFLCLSSFFENEFLSVDSNYLQFLSLRVTSYLILCVNPKYFWAKDCKPEVGKFSFSYAFLVSRFLPILVYI